MGVNSMRTRGRDLVRHEDLLRRGAKLAQSSKQLISDAKRLIEISAKLVASSELRKRTIVH